MEEDSLKVKEAIDRLPGGLLVTDDRSKILYANEAITHRTGFSVAESVGKKPSALWGGKMEKSFYRHMWEVLHSGGPFIGEVTNTRKNGDSYKEALYIAPVPDRFGKTRYFIHVRPGKEVARRAFEAALPHQRGLAKGERGSWAWLFSQLQGNNSKNPFAESSLEAAAFFQHVLVEPLAKLFRRRTDDAELIRAAQAAPEDFTKLYEKYYGAIKQYFLRRLSQDWETSEDLTQEVFARAFRHLPSFRVANASYYTYLLRIAHNALVNHYRKNASHTTVLLGEVEESASGKPFELMENLEELLRFLSPTEREVLLLKYQEGWKAKEIGGKIGKSENAVKLVLSRARKKLRQEWHD